MLLTHQTLSEVQKRKTLHTITVQSTNTSGSFLCDTYYCREQQVGRKGNFPKLVRCKIVHILTLKTIEEYTNVGHQGWSFDSVTCSVGCHTFAASTHLNFSQTLSTLPLIFEMFFPILQLASIYFNSHKTRSIKKKP